MKWDFPSGPVVKTLCFQGRGHRFNPWMRNREPTCCEVRSESKKKKKRKYFEEIYKLQPIYVGIYIISSLTPALSLKREINHTVIERC